MKKLLIALLFPLTAMAAASPKAGEESPSSVIDFSYAQRVLTFQSERNAISADGVIVVCLAANKSDWRDNTCLDANGKNAWTDVANINIPGHVLIGFEYRFTGSGGYRNLVLYFKKR